MPRSVLLRSVALSALLFSFPLTPALSQDATIEELGTLGGTTSWTSGLSADGSVVVGYSQDGGGRDRAFRWENGVMTDLGTLGGNWSYAADVSADGSVVVGNAYTAASWPHAFRWVGGVMTDLGTLGGNESYAEAASADGSVVVGTAKNASSHDRAFRWVGGVMTDLGTLGGNNSFTRLVSGDGSVVVGGAETAAFDQHAFRWEGGVMSDLGTLGGNYSDPSAISADGSVVVGTARNGSGQNHAFRWEGGVMTDLGTLGGDISNAYAVSADGSVVVGRAEVLPFQMRAFRWAGGVMTDLGTLGGTWSDAVAMSADGAVVAGRARDGGGDDRIFRWTAADGMQALDDILTNAGVDMTGWTLESSSGIAVSADGSVIAGRAVVGGNDRAFLMTMAGGGGIMTPQELYQSLLPAQETTTQAIEGIQTSAGQSLLASRQALGAFAPASFSVAAIPSGGADNLNEITPAAGSDTVRPLWDPRRLIGYVIGSMAFAHDQASSDYNGSGTTGVFARLSDTLALGVGITGGKSRREQRLDGKTSMDSLGGAVNLAYEDAAGLRLYATAGVTSLDIETDRHYLNGAGIDSSQGETDGLSYGAAVQLGYAMPVSDRISLMPYAALEAAKTKIDGYTESGGAFAASFEEQSSRQVTSRLGAEMTYGAWENVEIRTRAAWGHIVSDKGDDLNATVINTPQTIAYQENTDDWLEGGVTVDWQFAPSARFVTDLAGRTGHDGDNAATVTLGVTFGF